MPSNLHPKDLCHFINYLIYLFIFPIYSIQIMLALFISLFFNFFFQALPYRTSCCYCVDLDQTSFWQSTHRICHSGWKLFVGKIGSIDFIYLCKIIYVCQENRSLCHQCEAWVCSFQCILQILHDLMSLATNIFGVDLVSQGIDGNLTRDED